MKLISLVFQKDFEFLRTLILIKTRRSRMISLDEVPHAHAMLEKNNVFEVITVDPWWE